LSYNTTIKDRTLAIVIESDADGYFVACPVLQGCYTQGTPYQGAIANTKDAIQLHIEDQLAGGEEIPDNVSVSLATVEIGG
jgi:predicted RNase H-like HicB family nuclease